MSWPQPVDDEFARGDLVTHDLRPDLGQGIVESWVRGTDGVASVLVLWPAPHTTSVHTGAYLSHVPADTPGMRYRRREGTRHSWPDAVRVVDNPNPAKETPRG